MDLNLNMSEEERVVKKIKKAKKANKKKDSFINDSSDDYDIDDIEEYLPKTRSMCKKLVKRDKITPTKKAIYNSLIENGRNTRKKSSK